MIKVPGIIISAPSSGSGKTIITLGLLRALRDKGIKIQPFKNGPDYIDPGFHEIACNRKSYNLDTWAMNDKKMNHIVSSSYDTSLIITEGSMGLYDGVAQKGSSGFGSTAELSKKFGWPVILVLNVSGQAQSAAASALGFIKYNKSINVAGVILNFVASERHEFLIKKGMEQSGINVLGVISRQKELLLPERHLGLVQAQEIDSLERKIQTYAKLIKNNINLDEIIDIAKSNFFTIKNDDIIPPPAQRISLASDKAFSFIYPHILDNWKKSGVEIKPFSPLNNEVPDKDADLIWLPGGYPELYAKELSEANLTRNALHKLSKDVKIHGECGGYMSLGEALVDKNGNIFKMFGLLGLVSSYEKRKLHLGYRIAKIKNNSHNYTKFKVIRGHEFHYSSIISQPDQELYEVFDANNKIVSETGSLRENVSGTFFHAISEVK